jgi:RHS repeat-associated protein
MNRITQYLSLDDLLPVDDLDEAFAFDGNLHDLDPADLQNNQIRWFDPTPGKWLSEDPIGYHGDDVNVTPYVGRLERVGKGSGLID